MSGTVGHVDYSTVLEAPIDACWPLLRSFGSLPGLPGAVELINGKSGAEVGAERKINLPGDGFVNETLLALSDSEHFLTYRIDSRSDKAFPGPTNGYVAKLQLFAVNDGTNRTFARWVADWHGEDAVATADVISNHIFAAILKSTETEAKK